VTTASPVRVTPRDVVRILFRHKRKIALVSAGTLALTLLAIIVWPRSYASEARLFIRIGRESVALDPTATTGQTIMLQKTQEDEVNSALEIISSSEVLDQVVAKVGADRILGEAPQSGLAAEAKTQARGGAGSLVDRCRSWVGGWLTALRLSEPGTDEDLAVRQLKDKMDVWAPKQSTVIGVRYLAETPELARDIVAATTDAFLQTHLRLNHTSGSLAFFSEQADLLHRELNAAETELRDRKNEYKLASSDSKRQMLEGQISNVELELLKTERARRFSEAKIADLTHEIAGLEPQVVTNRVAGFANEAKDNMREKLYELELQESQLRSRYTDQHPLLVQIEEQRTLAEDILKSLPDDRTQTTESLNPNQRALELELMREKASADALRARHDSATAQREQLYQQLKDLNDQELELAQLERKVQLLDGKYRTHVDKLEQARVNDALEEERISNVNVVQPATLVLKPAEPKKRLILALGLLVATCGGLGVVFLAEALDQTLRTTEQTEAQLGLPVLLTLPPRTRRRRHDQSAERKAVSTIHVTNGAGEPVSIVSGRLARSDYQALAAQLRAVGQRAGGEPRTVGVVGCQAGSYGSDVAANLAIQAAKASPEQVLLIDANARHRRVARRFHLNGSPGLRELLAGETDAASCIHRLGIDNLAVMTAGGNGAPRLNGDAGVGVAQLNGLKEQYGLIVVDLPPVRDPDVAAPSAGWVDEVILVLEAEHTRIQAAQRVKNQLERAGVRVLGVVLENRREHIPKWLYRRL
jgi:uncharacterized protein involved in exopolysaccharide biosynthesis/Mrp family chromosome partitioning ATPase